MQQSYTRFSRASPIRNTASMHGCCDSRTGTQITSHKLLLCAEMCVHAFALITHMDVEMFIDAYRSTFALAGARTHTLCRFCSSTYVLYAVGKIRTPTTLK